MEKDSDPLEQEQAADRRVQALILSSPVLVAGTVPDPSECRRVSKVKPGTPAAFLGLEPGDLILHTETGTLLYYSRRRTRRIRVKVAVEELGIETEQTLESALRQIESGEFGSPELLALWNHERSSDLLKWTTQRLQSLGERGLFDRLRRKVVPVESAFTALHGAALIESGQVAEGYRWLEIFRARYQGRFGSGIDAVLSHYLALERWAAGDRAQAQAHLLRALTLGRHSRSERQWQDWELPAQAAADARVGVPFALREDSWPDQDPDTLHLVVALRGNSEKLHQDLQHFTDWLEKNSNLAPEILGSVTVLAPIHTLWAGVEGVSCRLLVDSEHLGARGPEEGDYTEYYCLKNGGIVAGVSHDPGVVWDALTYDYQPHESAVRSTPPLFSKREEKACEAWLRPAAPTAARKEVFFYLIPSGQLLAPALDPSQDGCPTDHELPENSVINFQCLERAQLAAFMGSQALNSWVDSYVLAPVQESVLTAPFFTIVRAEGQAGENFALLQSCLARCRASLRAGGEGVMDIGAGRWLSPQLLEGFERDVFDIKEHIGVQVSHGQVTTRGLREKFGATDLVIKLPSPHLAGAAIHLLYEVAEQIALGKSYHSKSLFRWRVGGYLCQLMFRSADEALELVDFAVENGVARPSTDAAVSLSYFNLGAPHWNLSYGWPPHSLPDGFVESLSEHQTTVAGLVPGRHKSQDAVRRLGPPRKTFTGGSWRWVFEDSAWDSLFHVEAKVSAAGILNQVKSNCLSVAGKLLTDSVASSRVESLLGPPHLARTFVAPPDAALVRSEMLWVTPHPDSPKHSLCLSCLFTSQDELWESTLTHIVEAPQAVIGALAPDFGKPLLTAFAPRLPLGRQADNREVMRIRAYMESSVQLVKQLVAQFGRPEWLGADLDGYAIVVGTFLLNKGIPERRVLEQIGLPAELYLDAFATLVQFLEHPTSLLRFSKPARARGLEYESLAGFRWLLESLTGSTSEDSDLQFAVDFAQVFEQYRAVMQGLNGLGVTRETL